MNYVIATDSFKDSLRSLEVGNAAKKGILKGDPEANVIISPMADGGEGTIDTLIEVYGDRAEKIQITVHDPLMNPTKATYVVLQIDGEKIAFIEAAESSGLMLVSKSKRNPMMTNTFGFGEQIHHALRQGIRRFVLSLGGTATHDGGIGMLQALGWEFFDKAGRKLENRGNPLLNVASFSSQKALPALKNSRFQVASDVLNPFYGEMGAAKVFAKQKGASEKDILLLEDGLKRLAKLFQSEFSVDVQSVNGTGAAGGLGGAIVACLGGTIHSGVDTMIRLTRLDQKIKKADIIITGEGSLDRQSIMGKVPIGVAKVAKKYGKKVIGIAGRIDMDVQELNKNIDAVFSIQTECRPLQDALKPEIAESQIEITAEQIARLLRF